MKCVTCVCDMCMCEVCVRDMCRCVMGVCVWGGGDIHAHKYMSHLKQAWTGVPSVVGH